VDNTSFNEGNTKDNIRVENFKIVEYCRGFGEEYPKLTIKHTGMQFICILSIIITLGCYIASFIFTNYEQGF